MSVGTRSAFLSSEPGDRADLPRLPDEQLLAVFFQERDDAAFAALLTRYGPLVYNVCRRVLKDTNDIEDAFQATFLVLVKKGATLRQPGRLANWLYGVAYRTARKVKTQAAIRNKTEREALVIQPTIDVGEMTLDALRGVLDEEIAALPEKYSLPLVLCYLEGKSNAEAAAQLGWPEGSMSRRLSRARELLRSRLVRRGLPISAALIVAVFAVPAAAVPASLAAAISDVATLAARGAPLQELVSPDTAALVTAVVTELGAPAQAALTAALLATILVLCGIIGWQTGTPGYAARMLFPGAPPPAACGSGCTSSCGQSVAP